MRLFISYSRRNKAIADYIATELRARGADVFIDYQELQAGNFVAQLGSQIEASDAVVLLLSPPAVDSPWVQAEIAWAFSNHKRIVPVLLEPCSLVNMFVVASLETVDFTAWAKGGRVDETLHKLARLLDLPLDRHTPTPSTVPDPTRSEPEPPAVEVEAVVLNMSEITDLFHAALEVEQTDPEQALFLYQRVLEVDSNYMNGRVRDFVERAATRLFPQRIAQLNKQVDEARGKGQWQRALSLVEDIHQLQRARGEAVLSDYRVTEFQTNLAQEPLYRQAIDATRKGRYKAASVILRDLYKLAPRYGDPEGVLRGQPISIDTVELLGLRAAYRVTDHVFGTTRRVLFSRDGHTLLTMTGNTIDAIRLATGEQSSFQVASNSILGIDTALSPRGERLFVAVTQDGFTWFQRSPTNSFVAPLHKNGVHATDVAFLPHGGSFITVNSDLTFSLFRTDGERRGGLLPALAGKKDYLIKTIPAAQTGLRVNDARFYAITMHQPPLPNGAYRFAVVLKGKSLVTGSFESHICLFEIQNETITFLSTDKGEFSEPLPRPLFLRDGKYLIWRGVMPITDSGRVSFQVAPMMFVDPFGMPIVRAVAPHADFAIGLHDQYRLWFTGIDGANASFQHANQHTGYSSTMGIAFSPDGTLLVTAHKSNLALWCLGETPYRVSDLPSDPFRSQ